MSRRDYRLLFVVLAGLAVSNGSAALNSTYLYVSLGTSNNTTPDNGAVGKGGENEALSRLDMQLEKNGDLWMPVSGRTPAHSSGSHYGRVVEGSIGASEVRLKVSMTIYSTDYIPGGQGYYEIVLTRGANDTLTGTFTGRYLGPNFTFQYHAQDVSGVAHGVLRQSVPVGSASFAAPAVGEHPRILLRKADLDYFRQKAATPFGQYALNKMGIDAVGLAMKYVLTGETRWSDASRALVEKMMADSTGGSGSGRREFGPRWEQVAVSYDLCYDVWPGDLKENIRVYCENYARAVAEMKGEWAGGEMSYGLMAHAGLLYPGLGFMGLAFSADQGPAPLYPRYPFGDSLMQPSIPPLSGYTPPAGTPQVTMPYKSALDTIHDAYASTLPLDWLHCGGLHPAAGEDPLAAVGGVNARPEAGMTLTAGGASKAFQKVPSTGYRNDGYTGKSLDLTVLTGRDFFSTNWFYTVVNNDKARTVEFAVDGFKWPPWLPDAYCYVNGVRRNPNDMFTIEPGTYSFLVVAPMGWCQAWGAIFAAPRFIEPTPGRVAHNTLLRREAWDKRMVQYELERIEWERTGIYSYAQELDYKMRGNLREYFRESINAYGHFPPTQSFVNSEYLVARYAAAYQRAQGERFMPFIGTDAGIHKWLRGERTPYQCSGSKACGGSVSEPGKPILPSLYGLLSDSTAKALCLKMWHDSTGVTDPANPVEALNWGSGVEVVNAFLNYPLKFEVKASRVPVARAVSAASPQFRAHCPGQGSLLLSWAAHSGRRVTVDLCNLKGERLRRVVDKQSAPGKTRHHAAIRETAPGVYTAVLSIDGSRAGACQVMLR